MNNDLPNYGMQLDRRFLNMFIVKEKNLKKKFKVVLVDKSNPKNKKYEIIKDPEEKLLTREMK